MATPAEWAAGYLDQAGVEVAAAREAIDPSVRAMLLQMGFEKIAKAALLKNGQWAAERAQATHLGASQMMTQLLTRRNLRKIRYTRRVLKFTIKPLVDELQGLHPAVARNAGRTSGPWLEYPWPTPHDVVAVPCRDLPNRAQYAGRSNRVAQLLRFATVLLKKHDHIFG